LGRLVGGQATELLKLGRDVVAQAQRKRPVMRRRSVAQVLEIQSITVTATVTGKAMQGRKCKPLSKGYGLGKWRSAVGQVPEMLSAIGVWHSER
jgi:hypothetical protein